MRLVRGLVVYAVALRLHRVGPSIDYVGLVAASAASWVGIPGPGEPVLIASAIFASRHKLDLGSVLLTAWAGATVGGMVGWLIGMKAGRAVVTAPGPFRHARTRAVQRGDEVFGRFAVIAILLTPSWIAGIHRVRTMVYTPTNAFGAAIWAVGIGGGAYVAGPPIVDLVADVGWVTVAAVAALVAAVIGAEIVWRRRRAHPRKD